jgi:hypothetical protein
MTKRDRYYPAGLRGKDRAALPQRVADRPSCKMRIELFVSPKKWAERSAGPKPRHKLDGFVLEYLERQVRTTIYVLKQSQKV